MTAGRFKLGIAALLGAGAAAAVAAALLFVIGSGHSKADPAASTVANRADAEREAQTLLAAVALPGSRQTAPRGPLATLLSVPPVASDVVERTREWTVAGTASRLRTRLRAHPPAGTRLSTGAGLHGLHFAVVRPPHGVSAAGLALTLVNLGGGRTAVLAVARVTWIVTRSASERVPAAAREVDITRGVPGRRPGLTLHVTSPARIAAIARVLDGLPIVQPGVIGCPAQITGLPEARITFRTAAGGRALATAAERADVSEPTTGCDPLRFSVGGRVMTPLLRGAAALRTISRIVGVRVWLPPFAA